MSELGGVMVAKARATLAAASGGRPHLPLSSGAAALSPAGLSLCRMIGFTLG